MDHPVRSVYASLHDIIFNAKTAIMSVGRNIVHKPLMFIAKHEIAWVHHCKYLGVMFLARSNLVIDVMPIKRKFYGALNSVFSRNSSLAEPVKLHLVRAFCLPLLVYCLGALDLSPGIVNELGVCWNDAFRKIFNYNRWESVKVLQFFCGCLDFSHIYDLFRLRFLSTVVTKLPFLNIVVSSLEMQYHTMHKLCNYYGASGRSAAAAVYSHFECTVMQSYGLQS